MELRRTTKDQVAALRAAKQSQAEPSIVPGFYGGLVEEAETFLIVEATGAGASSGTQPALLPEIVLGYALLLGREHDGHTHTTLIELGLADGHRDRYEDVLDLIREKAKPTAYLVRTDDCRLNATLLARGLQVEASALILVPEESAHAATALPQAGPFPSEGSSPQAGPLRTLVPLTPSHVAAVAELLLPGGVEPQPAPAHRHGPTAAETLADVRVMADKGEGWVFLEDGHPQAVVAWLRAQDGGYELLDFVVAQGEETGLAWAFAQASAVVRAAGARPAAVIDALDPVRRRILRAAGYYTAAAYMVFYDPLAGRPSVPLVSLEELRGMIQRKERFRLVDVMGEEHWREGHIPGAEWIDFRGLGREARTRYRHDETIVVYCNGFT